MDNTSSPENPEKQRDDQTAETPSDRDDLGRFKTGGPGGPGVKKGAGKSYRDMIPKVCKKVVDILVEKDDEWVRELKKTNPAALLTWTTQILRVAETLNQSETAKPWSISMQIQSMDEETLNARLLTAAGLLKNDRAYYPNSELSSTVDALRSRVVDLEGQLAKQSEPVVVVSTPSVKALPEDQAAIDKRQRSLDRAMQNDQRDPDVDAQAEQAEHIADFNRMLNLPEDDDSGVWQ